MKKTLIFIAIYPLNDDYALKFGFDIIRKKGFDVAILNVFDILFPQEIKETIPAYKKLNTVQGIPQERVGSVNDLIEKLKTIQGWKIAILIVSPYIKLLRTLKKLNIPYITLFCNIAPEPVHHSLTLCNRLKNFIKRIYLNPVEALSVALLYRLPKSFVGIDYPKYVVLGSDVTPYNGKAYGKATIIRAHSFDYDRFLHNKTFQKPSYIPHGEYYVHLECPPWDTHDYILLQQKAVLKKEEYASIINTFHDYVEQTTGKPVIIAAHPKHTEEENVYGGRPFLAQTEQLVKYSSGVFCHYSGAIKFAIIYRKPICFTSSRKLIGDDYFQRYINGYAAGLGAKIHFIDNHFDHQILSDNGFFNFDEEAYDRYEKNYITTNRSEKTPLWDIILERIIAQESLSK